MYLLVANTTNNNFFPNILHVRDITRDRFLLMFNVSCVSVKNIQNLDTKFEMSGRSNLIHWAKDEASAPP